MGDSESTGSAGLLDRPAASGDPRVARWLKLIEQGPLQRPVQPSAARRLRYQWWGVKEGLALYFYNHVVSRLPSHGLRCFFYRRIFDIGRESSILMGLTIFHLGKLIIGDNCVINSGCVLDSRAGIKIGNNVSLSNFVQIWSGGHDINSRDFRSYGGVTILEDYVWVASSAIVIGGTDGATLTLGEGCVVSAGSVVVRDVEPYSVVVGNPARKVAVRSRDLNYKLNYFPPFR